MFKTRVIISLLFIIFIVSTTTGYTAEITIPAGCKIDVNSCALNVPGDITINGTLEAGSGGGINLTGDWTNSGTFTCGTSTVTFDGTSAQSITTGSSHWNKIEVTNASSGGVTFVDGFTTVYLTDITPNSHLNFGFNETYEITAHSGLNLNGQTVGSRIVLRRNGGSGSNQWEINPSGGNWTVSYVDVKDSHNLAVAAIDPSNSLNLGNNTNWFTSGDSDGDGLPDAWELTYFDDLSQGANDDPDSDGLTNLGEYNAGTDPTDSDTDDDGMPDGWEVDNGFDPNNASPDKPVGISPPDDSVNITLTPTLEGSPYSDTELDPHISTEWQISSGIDFADTELIFDDTTLINKQTIQIPLAILKPNTTYYWRVRYSDIGGWSKWSEPVEFRTYSLDDFLSDNEGISLANESIWSDTGTVIQAYRQNPVNFLSNLPSNYQFYNDIFSFRIEGITPGATVQVTFQLDEPFQSYHKWLKYYPYLGTWDNTYAAHIVPSTIGTTRVTLEFKDGGFGDIDGLENGVIVDPSGPAIDKGGGDDDEEKSWCFIATATYGTPMANEVRVLSKFRNEYLLTNPIGEVFVKTYYKISPPVADFIREHPVLKNIVRGMLRPIVWLSQKAVR